MQLPPLATSLALLALGAGSATSQLTTGADRPPCVGPGDRARLVPWTSPSWAGFQAAQQPPPFFKFFPIGAQQNRDVWISFYNDMGGVQDFQCGNRTYGGHQGSDTLLRSFSEQLIGVPVFAALDGTVASINDGEPDMNTVLNPGAPANYVIINHGGGVQTWYWHLKKNSVLVNQSDPVRAGQQIGMVGSSGNSNWPHLHFQVNNSGAKEPFSGTCNPGPSYWYQQPAYGTATSAIDFGFNDGPVSGISPPNAWPRVSHWAQTNAQITLWVFLRNVPANSTLRWEIYRPNGTLQWATPNSPMNNPNFMVMTQRWSNQNGLFGPTGTWSVKCYVNSVLMLDAPVEVTAAPVPGFNRPPEQPAVSISPACPGVEDPLVCTVDGPLIGDDPDHDLLSYRYEWKVNGGTVRDVVSGGLADALQWNLAGNGDTVTCTITPNDGTVDGPSATATAVVGAGAFTSYCTAGTSASGCQTTLSGSGIPSASATSGFDLIASNGEGDKDGLFFFASNGRQANPWGSGTSFQCVVPPVRRGGLLNGTGTSGVCDGSFVQDLNAFWCSTCPKPLKNPGAGATVQSQLWYRDPFNTSNQTTSLSDALEFVVCP